MVLSPGARVTTRACAECGGPSSIRIWSAPCSNRFYRRHPARYMKFTCLIVRAWVCAEGHAVDAGSWFPEPPQPVRPEIVQAIRRLKAVGHRFFEWEKKS